MYISLLSSENIAFAVLFKLQATPSPFRDSDGGSGFVVLFGNFQVPS